MAVLALLRGLAFRIVLVALTMRLGRGFEIPL